MALTVTSSSTCQRDLQIATFECVREGALHDPQCNHGIDRINAHADRYDICCDMICIIYT